MKWALFFAVLALQGVFLGSVNGQAVARGLKKDDNFDYFMFSLQWSAGMCETSDQCVDNFERTVWTIHGLWPSDFNSSYPASCNKSAKFDIKELDPIRPQLDLYWPSYFANSSVSFWKHEWTKHGTCAESIDMLRGILRYFNATLQVYYSYNITQILQDTGFVPDANKPYSVSDVIAALKSYLHHEANVICTEASHNRSLFTGVRLCFDKESLSPIDCEYERHGCDLHGSLLYLPPSPAYSSKGVFLLDYFSTALFAVVALLCFISILIGCNILLHRRRFVIVPSKRKVDIYRKRIPNDSVVYVLPQ